MGAPGRGRRGRSAGNKGTGQWRPGAGQSPGRAAHAPGSPYPEERRRPAMEALRGWLVPLLLPERCFDELFLRLHLLHGAGRGRGRWWAEGGGARGRPPAAIKDGRHLAGGRKCPGAEGPAPPSCSWAETGFDGEGGRSPGHPPAPVPLISLPGPCSPPPPAVPCLKILLSKALGYAIVAGSVMGEGRGGGYGGVWGHLCGGEGAYGGEQGARRLFGCLGVPLWWGGGLGGCMGGPWRGLGGTWRGWLWGRGGPRGGSVESLGAPVGRGGCLRVAMGQRGVAVGQGGSLRGGGRGVVGGWGCHPQPPPLPPRSPPSEAAAGAEGGGGPERGRAERPGRAAGAAGPGGDGGLRLRPRLPLQVGGPEGGGLAGGGVPLGLPPDCPPSTPQRLGGSSLSPPADTDHRLPHPALWGAHRPRSAPARLHPFWGGRGRLDTWVP